MTLMIRASAAMLALLPSACDRSNGPTDVVAAHQLERRRPPMRSPAPIVGGNSIMRPAIQAETPKATAGPIAPTVVTIRFAYDGATLDDAARKALEHLVRDPETNRASKIVVRGHTDAAGSDQTNLAISSDRAAAVQDYLVAARVKPPITVIALGERRPLRPSATVEGADDPAGRAINRRVEITILPAV